MCRKVEEVHHVIGSQLGVILCAREGVPRVWNRELPRLIKKKINHFIYLFRRESLRRRPSRIAMSNSTLYRRRFGRFVERQRVLQDTKWHTECIPAQRLLDCRQSKYRYSLCQDGFTPLLHERHTVVVICSYPCPKSLEPKPSEVLNVIEVPIQIFIADELPTLSVTTFGVIPLKHKYMLKNVSRDE